MAQLDIQFDILNDAPASASPVEANFNRIEQHINQELIERDGGVAMLAELQLAGDPVSPLAAAPKQYVDSVFPIGIIMMYGGSSTPPGGRWAICNGAEVESVAYPDLYAIIGTSYTAPGTPAGRFNLPNLVDRFPVGAGTIGALGATGGSRDPAGVPAHTHTIDHAHPATDTGIQSANHTHVAPDHLHSINGNTGDQSNAHSHVYQVRNDPISGSLGVVGRSNAGGTIVNFQTAGNTEGHSHRVDFFSSAVRDGSGSTPASFTTTGNNVNHWHQFTAPTHAGNSGSTGVVVTDSNLPPYVAISYIIRVQ